MFSLPELQLLRAGLDSITIKGADAQFVAQLQLKVEQLLHEASQPPKEKSK
jgi:hypothetical protein